MNLSIIAAVAENGVIGRGGKIPWRLSGDLKRFAELTRHHSVICGRKTYESIIRFLGRPLKDRTMIVVTRQPGKFPFPDTVPDDSALMVVDSWKRALKCAPKDEEVFVIGGEEIYRSALPEAGKMYLTQVHANIEGDAFFPGFDIADWKIISCELNRKDDKNEYDYTFITLKKKQKRGQGK